MIETNGQLDKLGSQRATTQECRNYLTKLSLECLEIIKAAVDGHYGGQYFQDQTHTSFDVDSPTSVRRLRAAIQFVNQTYAETMRTRGPKYFVSSHTTTISASKPAKLQNAPTPMSHQEALEWVSRVLVRSRGKEPIGNYNPLIIGELFWEQSSKWRALAEDHADQVADMCKMFTNKLLEETCPKDVRTRPSELKVKEALESRKARATAELLRILEDKQDFPAVYNHYYTDNVQKSRNKRKEAVLSESIEAATTHQHVPGCNSNHTSASVDVAVAIDHYHGKVDHDMERYSCEEALDCLLSIYKVGSARGLVGSVMV